MENGKLAVSVKDGKTTSVYIGYRMGNFLQFRLSEKCYDEVWFRNAESCVKMTGSYVRSEFFR